MKSLWAVGLTKERVKGQDFCEKCFSRLLTYCETVIPENNRLIDSNEIVISAYPTLPSTISNNLTALPRKTSKSSQDNKLSIFATVAAIGFHR